MIRVFTFNKWDRRRQKRANSELLNHLLTIDKETTNYVILADRIQR